MGESTRPLSMKRFDQIFMAHMVVNVFGIFVGMADAQRAVLNTPGGLSAGNTTADIVGLLLRTTLLIAFVWFLISRLRLNFIRWAFALFTGRWLVATLLSSQLMVNFSPLQSATVAVNLVLQAALLVFLFLPDSNAWFARQGEIADFSGSSVLDKPAIRSTLSKMTMTTEQGSGPSATAFDPDAIIARHLARRAELADSHNEPSAQPLPSRTFGRKVS